jgi:hypothetical protein
MAKFLSDAMIDSALNYVATATEITVCSAEPTDYAKAHTTYMLVNTTLSGGDFAKADDVSGRKVTIAAKSGLSVTNPGTATYIALTITASSTLIGYTTCTSQVISAGNTVNIPAFKLNIADPT